MANKLAYSYGGKIPSNWNIRIDSGDREGRLIASTRWGSQSIVLVGKMCNEQEVEEYILSQLKVSIRDEMLIHFSDTALETIRRFASNNMKVYGPRANGKFKGPAGLVHV